jgi:hypothetical protein
MVYYELLMDREEFGNILDDELYNLQGQMDYFASGSPVDFAFGNYGKNIGAVELKLAWKIMAGKDIPSRFFTMDAYVLEENEWVRKTVGLVGMHIAHKTLSSNRWVWSTFEHIDNVRVNDLEAVTLAQEELTLRPSFNNPDCAICPVNTIPQPPLNVTLDAETNKTMTRTQVMREIPIPEAIDELNSQVQALLKAQDSVWQYYELVGTQYITNNNPQLAPAGPGQGLPTSITNESGGFPAPTYLVNSVIETYLQKGNQPASDLVAGSLDADQQIVFGTQSCMGCHYSADIAVARVKDKAFDLPATGDFSFLLGRAQWMKALFDIESTADMIEQLDKEDGLPPELQTRFEKEGVLGPNDKVQIKKDEVIPNKWVITMEQPGQSQKKYIIRKEEDPQSKSDILTAYILQK